MKSSYLKKNFALKGLICEIDNKKHFKSQLQWFGVLKPAFPTVQSPHFFTIAIPF